jgi:ADP-ribosylglycohydrolase
VLIAAVLDGLPDTDVRCGVEQALALEPGATIERAVDALGNGTHISAQDTVPLVLWCAAHQLHDYRGALWTTVSALGDRDTTCAMVGGIVACRVGRQGLPSDWFACREQLPTDDISRRSIA